jgi:hypothetical protein
MTLATLLPEHDEQAQRPQRWAGSRTRGHADARHTNRSIVARERSRAWPARLRALADALAATLHATVIVTDARLEVLTYHVAGDAVGVEAQMWILHRTVPASVREQLPSEPFATRRPADGVLQLGGPRTGRWSVVPVRAAGTVVGGVWTFGPDNPLADPARAELLQKAAQRAAELIVPADVLAGPTQVSRSQQLHDALLGNAANDLIGARTTAHHLIAIRASAGQGVAALESLVELQLAAAGVDEAVTRIDDTVFALLPDRGSLEVVLNGARDAARAQPALRCAVSDPVTATSGLVAARADVERLLSLSAATGVVSHVGSHRSHLVIAEIAEHTRHSASLAQGPVQHLAGMDATRRTEYLQTLRAYFDTGHDLQRAADRLFVHRNTLRYRLERIRLLTGLDVNDPVTQLVADLQLRIHDLAPADSPAGLCNPPVVTAR